MTLQAPPVADTVPAHRRRTWTEWVRENLFNTWYNTLLTLALGGVLVWGGVSLLRVILGADFAIIRRNLTLFMVGQDFLRSGELWRPWSATFLLAMLIGVMTGSAAASARDRAEEAGIPHQRTTLVDILLRFWPLIGLVAILLFLTRTLTPTLLTLAVTVAGLGLYYLGRGLPRSVRRFTWVLVLLLLGGAYLALAGFGGEGWEDWGGLHLNLFLTVAGILLAFPFGLLMALGRRSSLPAVRVLSVTYIEFIRGVPLITLLLAGQFAIGFLIPRDIRPGFVTRMLIAITVFEAAYVAEVVRGGLQAVGTGQVEASQALGMPPWKTTRLIVLPQALRATIPSMVGQFISLWKDTTLVAILGANDLLNGTFIVNSQQDFLGKGLFGLTLGFAALVFWVGSYTMSRESRRLERKLGVGER